MDRPCPARQESPLGGEGKWKMLKVKIKTTFGLKSAKGGFLYSKLNLPNRIKVRGSQMEKCDLGKGKSLLNELLRTLGWDCHPTVCAGWLVTGSFSDHSAHGKGAQEEHS